MAIENAVTGMGKVNGRHVLAGFVGGFAIIFAVNFYMAYEAVHTFPGLEVENSYVASQHFDAERNAQLALGWDVTAERIGNEIRLRIRHQGQPVQPKIEEAILSRATTTAQDHDPKFTFDGKDYVAHTTVPPGNWDLRVRLRSADGTLYHKRLEIHGGRAS